MGSAVAECLASYSGVLTTDVLTYGKVNVNVPIEFIGIKDAFGQTGTPDELIEYYKMGESHIRDAVKKVISRKART
jgi:transketolase